MDLAKVKYLVLEDNRVDQLILFDLMHDIGIKDTQIDCCEAVSDIRGNHYEFILCDLNLKDSFQLDTVRKVHKQFPESIIVVLSGMADIDLATEAIYEGAQDYLIKGETNAIELKKTLLFAHERNHLLKKVKQNEERFRGLIENNYDGILIHDENLIISYASPSVESTLNFSYEELIGKRLIEMIHPDDRAIIMEYHRKLIKSHSTSFRFRIRIINKEERYIWIDVTVSDHRNTAGINGIVSNFKNIDQEKRAIEQQKQSERRLAEIINAMPGAVLSYQLFPDGTDKLLYISEGAEKIWGISVEAALNDFSKMWKTVVDQDINGMKQSIEKSARNLSIWNHRFSINNKEKIRWINAIGTPSKQKDESVIWNTLAFDISDQVKMEQALKDSNERFELASKATNDIIWDWNILTGELYSDLGFEKFFGDKNTGNYIHMDEWVKFIHPMDKERIISSVQKTIYTCRETIWEDEFRLLSYDGCISYVSGKGYVVYGQDENPLRMVGALQDLTENRKLLYDIKERNKELSCLFSISKLINDHRNDIPLILKESVKLLPPTYQYPEVACSRINIHDQIYESANFKISKWKQKAVIKVEDQAAGFIEVYYKQEKPKSDEGPFLKEERNLINTIAKLLGNMLEKKKAEEQLKKSEANLQAIFDNTTDGYLLVNRKGAILSRNKQAEDFFKMYQRKPLGENLIKSLLKEYRSGFQVKLNQVFEGIQVSYERNFQVGNRRLWFILSFVPVKTRTGKVVGACLGIKNVTNIKQAEYEVKRVAANMEALLNSTEDAYILIDHKFKILSYNAQAEKNAERLAKDIQAGKSIIEFIPDPKDAFEKAVSKAFAGQKIDYMSTFQMREREISMHIIINPVVTHENKINEVSVVIRDITERKGYEEALLFQQQLLSNAQQLANLGSFEWDLKTNIITATEEFFQIFRIDQEIENLKEAFFNKIYQEDRLLVDETLNEAINGNHTFDLQFRTIEIEGQHKVIRGKGIVNVNKRGQASKIFCTVQDITDQKSADQALQTGQELERNRLAKDLHDDIGQLLTATKFRLETIEPNGDGILAEQVNAVKELLTNTIKEVRNISRNLSTKILEHYGLETAIRELFIPFQEINDNKVNMNYNIVTQLDIKFQTAIYRILQEATNNIIKYAEASEVNIQVVEKNNSIFLQVRDNGKGFNIDNQSFSKTHGLHNMRERTNLFMGQFNIDSELNKGTIISCKFPKIK